MKFTPKYQLTILSIREDVSRTKAIAALADVTDLSLKQAKYITDQLPQLLSQAECETFISVVMTESEVTDAQNKLAPFFELHRMPSGINVLPYGMTPISPWEL